jgi:hypothetical protein
MVKHFESYDYVVLNCGHHPASGAHWTYEEFNHSMNLLVRGIHSLEAMRETPQLLFWLESTAQPLRQDFWVFEKKDWRTWHRLLLFDALAKDAFVRYQLKIRILPAFDSTMSLFDKVQSL